MSRNKILPGLLVLAALVFPAATPQRAAGQLEEIETFCNNNQPGCGSDQVVAQYREDNSGRAIPFEVEILSSGGGRCLRIEVVGQPTATDLEAVLIAPDGTVWRNDDAGAASTASCNLCPLIKAVTQVAGWYTLQISPFNGSAGAPGRFFLAYGLYSPGDVSCSGATTPQAPEPQPLKPSGLESPGAGFIGTDDAE